MRPSSRTCLAVSFLAIAAAYGCSGPTNGMLDPGADQPAGDTAGSGSSATTDQGSGGGGGSGTTTESDGGTAAGKDGAAPGSDSGVAHDGGSADAGVDASTCINAVTSPGSGHHNAGQDCGGCHDNLSASIRWTVSGTLYNAATGGSAVSGATVVVVDANGKKLSLPTYDNGNFYTTTAVTFPLTVRATKCPADLHMVSAVQKGSCNASGCHTSAMRVHVP